MKPEVIWNPGGYIGDNRQLAMVGQVAIGAIFLPGPRGKYTRYRVWCTSNMNPVEGTMKSVESAREEVEARFYRFLMLAGIMTADEWTAWGKRP